jgi:hypothetical protein
MRRWRKRVEKRKGAEGQGDDSAQDVRDDEDPHGDEVVAVAVGGAEDGVLVEGEHP